MKYAWQTAKEPASINPALAPALCSAARSAAMQAVTQALMYAQIKASNPEDANAAAAPEQK